MAATGNGWDLLNEEIDRYWERMQLLEQIAKIIASKPELIENEPELKTLLTQARIAA